MTDASLPEPGWYPDPAGGPDVRWWDGAAWSGATHPRPSTLPPSALQPLAPQLSSPQPSAQQPSAPPWQPLTEGGGVDVEAYPHLFGDEGDDGSSRPNSRRSVLVAVVALVALVAIGAVAATAMFSSASGRTRLDTVAIEDRIAAELTAQTTAEVSVTCPRSVTIAAGTTFTCSATTDDGSITEVTIRQVDDEGNVRWHVSG